MTDIVERLRIGRETCGVDMCRTREARSGCTCAEAADEIERLREALKQVGLYAWQGDTFKIMDIVRETIIGKEK